MTFLLCLNIVLLLSLWFVMRQGLAIREPLMDLRLPAMVVLLGSGVVSFHLFLPWLALETSTAPAAHWHGAMMLAGAALTAAGFGLALYRVRKAGTTSRAQAGWIVAMLGCAYLAYTGIDHLVFYRDDGRAGYVDVSIAREAGIRCDAAFVLVRLSEDATTATYRCPHNIVFGAPLHDPFVPWPSYREADSPALARSLYALGARGPVRH